MSSLLRAACSFGLLLTLLVPNGCTRQSNNAGAANGKASQVTTTDAAQEAVRELGTSDWLDADRLTYRPPQPAPDYDDPTRIHGRLAAPKSVAPATTPPPTTGTGTGWFTFDLDLSVVVWFVLGLLLTGLIIYLMLTSMKSWRGRKRIKLSTASIAIDPARVSDLPFEAEAAMEDPFAHAKRLIELNDYNAAILFLYGYMLLALDRAAKISLHRGKTNRMYLFELQSERRLRELLWPVMLAFEDVFFGRHDLDRERFMSLWMQLDEFHTLLAPVVAAEAKPAELAST